MVRAFGVIALLAVSVQLVLLVTLHALPTGYNPVRDAISDYGVGRYRAYFWAQLIAGGTACIGVALALAELHPYVPTFVVVMLFLNAVARAIDQTPSRITKYADSVLPFCPSPGTDGPESPSPCSER